MRRTKIDTLERIINGLVCPPKRSPVQMLDWNLSGDADDSNLKSGILYGGEAYAIGRYKI